MERESDLIEGDVEKGARRQALQHPDCQHMSSSGLRNIFTIQKYKRIAINTDLLHMDSDNDANEDPDGGDNAQDWHVENNAALFQPWGQKMNHKRTFLWNWK